VNDGSPETTCESTTVSQPNVHDNLGTRLVDFEKTRREFRTDTSDHLNPRLINIEFVISRFYTLIFEFVFRSGTIVFCFGPRPRLCAIFLAKRLSGGMEGERQTLPKHRVLRDGWSLAVPLNPIRRFIYFTIMYTTDVRNFTAIWNACPSGSLDGSVRFENVSRTYFIIYRVLGTDENSDVIVFIKPAISLSRSTRRFMQSHVHAWLSSREGSGVALGYPSTSYNTFSPFYWTNTKNRWRGRSSLSFLPVTSQFRVHTKLRRRSTKSIIATTIRTRYNNIARFSSSRANAKSLVLRSKFQTILYTFSVATNVFGPYSDRRPKAA